MQGGHADVDAAPRGCYFLVLQGWDEQLDYFICGSALKLPSQAFITGQLSSHEGKNGFHSNNSRLQLH